VTAHGDRDQPAAVELRPIQVSDADRVHEWASQERACRFQPWGPNTVEETVSFVTEAALTWGRPDGSRLVWAAASPALGLVGIGEIKRRSPSCAEIAYAVHVDYWGRGLGTEIARLLLPISFADPEVERVQGTCDPRNLASAAVLLRTGLVLEGTLRHTVRLRDGWRDSAMHSILRDEWTAQATSARRGPGTISARGAETVE
jgi:[ribosomal protein S5]-alanine N-acetyltransferase